MADKKENKIIPNPDDIEMAPKEPSEQDGNPIPDDPVMDADTIEDEPLESDMQEIVNVNNSLDLLNSALDSIEQKNNSIHAQLLELLSSSREIRQSIREENEKFQANVSNENEKTNQ